MQIRNQVRALEPLQELLEELILQNQIENQTAHQVNACNTLSTIQA